MALTCPWSSSSLFVSLSLSKLTTWRIHVSPEAGESGWMYTLGGTGESAFPATIHLELWYTYLNNSHAGSVISTVSKMHVCPSAFYHLPWDQVCSVRFEVQFKSMSIIIITDLKHLSCATFLIIDFIIFLCRPRGLSSFDWWSSIL